MGPAIGDIEDNDLGICVPYSEESVLEAMDTLLNEACGTRDPQRLHKWVEENRSMKAVGNAVATYIADRTAK